MRGPEAKRGKENEKKLVECFLCCGPHRMRDYFKRSKIFTGNKEEVEPIENKKGLIFLDINIAGQKRSALVDTEALDLFILEKAMDKFGLSISKSTKRIKTISAKLLLMRFRFWIIQWIKTWARHMEGLSLSWTLLKIIIINSVIIIIDIIIVYFNYGTVTWGAYKPELAMRLKVNQVFNVNALKLNCTDQEDPNRVPCRGRDEDIARIGEGNLMGRGPKPVTNTHGMSHRGQQMK
ncbi:hypothetical protein J1N35_019468 [Gossypium stocksii]|uniref:Uncharacterized protein n=1 Tax=Gossypium stocksii TaxID=47602 RepID=A0A9D3VR06_9ROSI|nr:hypothetical protein J1N35_019468 [Gossypium stocksii]